MSSHCLSSHFALSALAAFRTLLHFCRYSLSASSLLSLFFFKILFSWTRLIVSGVIHFLAIISFSGIVSSAAFSIAMAILFAFSSKSCDGSACPRCRSSATLYALLIPSSLSLAMSLRFLNCALCFFFSLIETASDSEFGNWHSSC